MSVKDEYGRYPASLYDDLEFVWGGAPRMLGYGGGFSLFVLGDYSKEIHPRSPARIYILAGINKGKEALLTIERHGNGVLAFVQMYDKKTGGLDAKLTKFRVLSVRPLNSEPVLARNFRVEYVEPKI